MSVPAFFLPRAALVVFAAGAFAGACQGQNFPTPRPSPTPGEPLGLSLDASAPLKMVTPAPKPGATPYIAPDDKRFQNPKVLKRMPVRYPEVALLNRVEGTVHALFSVDETGKVTGVVANPSSGSAMLDAAVLDYDLRQWTFQPATFDGKAVPGVLPQELEFHLDPNEERAVAEKRLAAPLGTPDAPYPKEALALKAKGAVTIGLYWSKLGLVDKIFVAKGSGSNILDRAALRYAYENWRISPKDVTDKEFQKVMIFLPPDAP